jgi:hypothetical protein
VVVVGAAEPVPPDPVPPDPVPLAGIVVVVDVAADVTGRPDCVVVVGGGPVVVVGGAVVVVVVVVLTGVAPGT